VRFLALDPALFGEPLTLAASAEASDGVEFGICRIEGPLTFSAVTNSVATGTGIVHDSTRFGSSVGESLRNRTDTIPVVLRVVAGGQVRLELQYSGADAPVPPVLIGDATAEGYGGSWTCGNPPRITVTGTWVLGR